MTGYYSSKSWDGYRIKSMLVIKLEVTEAATLIFEFPNLIPFQQHYYTSQSVLSWQVVNVYLRALVSKVRKVG